jgi:hypothetical protein
MSDDHLLMCCCCRAACQHIVEEKDAEIASLREAIRRLADQDATLSVCDGNVTVTLDATLTNEEREAVKIAIQWLEPDSQVADKLRELLERLGGQT